ncbi:hypothetical protein G5C51_18960 [Streptomyces sp. A7024]|uniref:Peptidase M60 domain-containing protein n=1 Tax=Streptomyces coryli TaxID=1128680 RepID=A0A6G4U156_9ACTN|nr:hypothetical protein [Streptomyces coryli]
MPRSARRGGPINLRHLDVRPRAEHTRTTVQLGEAAQPIPLYVLGKTDHDGRQRMLKSAKALYAQLRTARVQLTVPLTTACRHAEAEQDELLKAYGEVAAEEDKIGGGDGDMKPTPLLQQIVEYRTGFTAHATHDCIGIPTSSRSITS